MNTLDKARMLDRARQATDVIARQAVDSKDQVSYARLHGAATVLAALSSNTHNPDSALVNAIYDERKREAEHDQG